MNKPLAITAIALGLVAAAPIGSALAHPVSVRIDAPDFGIQIGVPTPRVYLPAPVIVAPPPVVYVPAPRVIAPQPVFYRPPYYRVRYDYPYPRHRHRHHWDERNERRDRWCDD